MSTPDMEADLHAAIENLRRGNAGSEDSYAHYRNHYWNLSWEEERAVGTDWNNSQYRARPRPSIDGNIIADARPKLSQTVEPFSPRQSRFVEGFRYTVNFERCPEQDGTVDGYPHPEASRQGSRSLKSSGPNGFRHDRTVEREAREILQALQAKHAQVYWDQNRGGIVVAGKALIKPPFTLDDCSVLAVRPPIFDEMRDLFWVRQALSTAREDIEWKRAFEPVIVDGSGQQGVPHIRRR
ncbi:MAG: hypothetical protein M1821_007991 [Bathelium mastoideum]|nr:MAG: hypothetical protein M1821_007991 [Bathelium mastoideum]